MASKNTSIALGAPFIEFARSKVESGEFATTSEVVREAMRHYMAEEKRAETLDRALQAGLDSGPAEPWNLEQFLTEMHARHQGAA